MSSAFEYMLDAVTEAGKKLLAYTFYSPIEEKSQGISLTFKPVSNYLQTLDNKYSTLQTFRPTAELHSVKEILNVDTICSLHISLFSSYLDVRSISALEDKFKASRKQSVVLGLTIGTISGNISLLTETIEVINKMSQSMSENIILSAQLSNGFTLLHIAVLFDQKKTVLIKLLQLKVLKDQIDSSNNSYNVSPLLLASLLQRRELFDALVQQGSDPLQKNVRNETCALLNMYSCRDSDRQVIDLLKKYISPQSISKLLRTESSDGTTVFKLALVKSQSKLFQALDSLSSIKAEASRLLVYACEGHLLDIVNKLVLYGADVNWQSGKGKTCALHVACYLGYTDVVEYLLNNGANPLLRSVDKLCSLSFASNSGHLKVMIILLERILEKGFLAANRENIENSLLTSLLLCLREKKYNCARLIILRGFENGFRFEKSVRYVIAEKCEDEEVIELLLSTIELNDEFLIGNEHVLISAARSNNLKLFSKISALIETPKAISSHPDVRKFVNSFADDELPEQVENIRIKCVICLEKDSNTKFLPCGHIQCCRLCAHQSIRADPRCPLCRHQIKSFIDF